MNAQQVADLVVDSVRQAAESGTFAVAGLLLGPNGELLHSERNRVIDGGQVYDPTAHGERQLVDWYYQERYRGRDLPEPGEVTLVSSLDPCVMCTGSVLSAGIDLCVLTADPYNGVNCRPDFATLPQDLRPQARANFAYFAVKGVREFQGPASSRFREDWVDRQTEELNRKLFLTSAKSVKSAIHQEADEQTAESTGTFHPGPEIAEYLLQAASDALDQGNNYDAAALIGPDGELVIVRSGQERISPIRTPFLELTRSYATLRRARPKLPSFKNCRVLTLFGPGRRTIDLVDLGAYGSTIEGPLPAGTERHWQYIIPRQPQDCLAAMIEALPPFYNQEVGLQPLQVRNSELIETCSNWLGRSRVD